MRNSPQSNRTSKTRYVLSSPDNEVAQMSVPVKKRRLGSDYSSPLLLTTSSIHVASEGRYQLQGVLYTDHLHV